MNIELMSREALIAEITLLQARVHTHERDEIVQDLRVHQLELELQNRNLRDSQIALEDSRNRYQELYDFAPIPFCTLNLHGSILEVNLACAAMLGRQRETIPGLPLLALLKMPDPRPFWHHLRLCREGRKQAVTELSFSCQNGPEHTVLATSVPVFDQAGNPAAFRTTFTDITERVRAAEEREGLSRREARIRSGFESLDRASAALTDALARAQPASPVELFQIVVDHAAELADAGSAALGMVGAPSHPLAPWVFSGSDSALATAIAGQPNAVALLAEVVRIGQTLRLRDLRTHPAFTGFAAHPPALKSFLAVSIVQRGTAVGQLYLANKRSAEEFSEDDQRFVELLATRASKMLEIARLNEEVKAAVRARDKVLAIVSHDLRNPLSTIGLTVNLLARQRASDLSAAELTGLDVIRGAAEQMRRLIDDLLNAATIEAGTFTVMPGPEAVQPILDEVSRTIAPMAQAKHIRLELDAAAALPLLHADRPRIIQVLCNLLSNAVKFAPERSTIQIRAWRQEDAVQFAVSDQGQGMAADQLLHIFDRYWKGAAEARRGFGLGLCIAKGIVEAHGGRIWAESKLGGGTTVTFTLPISPALPERPPVLPLPAAVALPRGLRLLLVDDEASAAAALAELLTDEGFVTTTAKSGEQALAKIKGTRPDVAVVDVEMPGMSGLELLQALRERYPGLPGVIMSGLDPNDSGIKQALATPGIRFVQKPIDVDALLDAIGQLVGNAH